MTFAPAAVSAKTSRSASLLPDRTEGGRFFRLS